MITITLPPLPESVTWSYTVAQMQAYGQACADATPAAARVTGGVK